MIGSACHPCCGGAEICCSQLGFSDFQHATPGNTFAVSTIQSAGSGIVSLTTPLVIIDQASGTVVESNVAVNFVGTQVAFVDVIISVETPGEVAGELLWSGEIYFYRYVVSGNSVQNLCRDQFLTITPAQCSAITKRVRLTTQARGAENSGTLASAPNTAGTISIGLATPDTNFRFVDGDLWGNISEITVQIATEVVGGSTISMPFNAPLGVFSAVDLSFSGLSVELALERDFSQPGLAFSFNDFASLDVLTPSPVANMFVGATQVFNPAAYGQLPNNSEWESISSFDCPCRATLQLFGGPACVFGGQSFAQLTRLEVPLAAVERVTDQWEDLPTVTSGPFVVKTDGNFVGITGMTQSRLISVPRLFLHQYLVHDGSGRLLTENLNNVSTIFSQQLPATITPVAPAPDFLTRPFRFQGLAIASGGEGPNPGGDQNLDQFYEFLPVEQYVDVQMTIQIVAVS